jgi:glycosyltransferase involved in cell wall biosynthesis
MATIASLRGNFAGNIELIIVDRGSTDETRAITDYLPGARLLRFDRDIGWAQAANAGSQFAAAQSVLFLAAEAQLGPGAIEHALSWLDSDASFGAVGGMIIQPNGAIAQAGGILWNHGGTHDYQRGASPLAPEANFVRFVDFCSSAFLLVRAALLTQLGGFDPACAAIGYEAIDLCARIAKAGGRIIYDPSVILFHDDTPHRPHGPDASFLSKHADLLAERFPPGGPVQVFARHTGPLPLRLLFIEDTVPLRRIGSGFVRSNDVVRAMAELGWQVTVYPVNGCAHDPARAFGDMPESVEVIHDRGVDRFKEFLRARRGYYNLAWVARSHNLDRVKPSLPYLSADGAAPCPVILDTEAVSPSREAESARLRQETFDFDARMQQVFAAAADCAAVLAVNEAEAVLLRGLGLDPVSVVGHMIEPRPTPRAWRQRAGLLFVGAIHTADSPNMDSLIWFVDSVLPLIEQELGWETRLTIAGYTAPGIDLARFEQHPRVTLCGPVSNLEPLYSTHRVFVAPTRYAAGTPYKVFEAASFGVPVVATELLRRQLDWRAGQEILTAGSDDPGGFAAAVVAAYREETLWQSVRDAALRRIEADNSKDQFVKAIDKVLSRCTKKPCLSRD